MARRRLQRLRFGAPEPPVQQDEGAGFEFPLWRAYALPNDGHIEVILDRVRLVHGVHVQATEHDCRVCHLPLRQIDGAHIFCTAGCDARTIAGEPGTPERRLPEAGIAERQFEVRGRFDAEPVTPISECLGDARRLAHERTVEERANHEHLADLFERARILQSPAARAGMAGACWVAIEADGRDAGTSARVTVRRTAPGHLNGIEVESWALFAVDGTWDRIPGALERKRDQATVEKAAQRVEELMSPDYRPRYARLRSSLSSSSPAAPSSTTSPVEST